MANKIGVGIVGVHSSHGWARVAHIPALRALPEYSIAALSHHDLEIAREAAREFDVPHAFSNVADLVSCPDVDLVVITVKVPRHYELVSAAIQAGKSVFCEWPLGNGLQEAVELDQLARRQSLRTFVGLQSRASPELRFIRDLVRNNYVGEVLSSTLVGSGIIGGADIAEAFAYTLNPANGASVLNVAFAHAIDSLCFVLDSTFEEVLATLQRRRKTARVIETDEIIPMQTPDQIAVAGTLKGGQVISAHYRGGMSRATNYQLEINGTDGDLIVTGSLGYPGVGMTTLRGATGTDTELQDLHVPAMYLHAEPVEGPAQNVFRQYRAIAQDLNMDTNEAATFADAVELHRFIDAVERAAVGGLKLRV